MKKLHVFDSLKFVRAMFVAVATAFILNVAHADTTAIQSVIAYGKTEQSATPTPTNPVPIMTNNGVLKVSPNLFDINTVVVGKAVRAGNTSAENPLGSEMDNTSWSCSDYIRVQPNTIYTYVIPKSTTASAAGMVFYSNKSVESAISGILQESSLTRTFSTPANCNYVRFSWKNSDGNAAKLVQGTSAEGIYTNGLTETIRDAAGHKATAEMLLSVGDYKDEQNITTGAITRKVGVKVFDGTENFSYTDSGKVFSWYSEDLPLSSVTGSAFIFSSHFRSADVTPSSSNRDGYVMLFNTSSVNRIGFGYFLANGDTSVFRQFLAEQYAAGTPVIVVYPLATETTESVTAQQMTTAPVRQTLGAIMNMPIKTILTDNSEIMSGAEELIKIATTKYNEESFTDVQDTLTGVFNAVDTVVTQTMSQAQAIDTIANNKQTRPDETCPVGKNCLLVEDEQGVPHWYVIANADDAFPTYTELQYIRLANGAFITTNIYPNQDTEFLVDFQHEQDALKWLFGTRSYPADASNGQNPINKFALQVFSTSNGGVWMQFDNTTNLEYGTTTVASNAASRLARHQCGIKNQRVWCDGNFIAWSSNGGPTNISNFTATNPLVIGGGQTSTGYSSSTFIGKIYGATDLVPCRRDTDSAVGLCRTSTGDFFGNSAGVGTITAGPEI